MRMHYVATLTAALLGAVASAAAAPVAADAPLGLHVDCGGGDDDVGTGTAGSPFRTVARAQAALRAHRAAALAAVGAPPPPAIVHISGLCELHDTLQVDNPSLDSNVAFVGTNTAILSGGTKITVPPPAADGSPVQVDLTKFNYSTATLGTLLGRGYSGGSACINVYLFEPSAAELFFRPDTPESAAGARSSGAAEDGAGLRLARWPNVQLDPAVPTKGDWAKIHTVTGGQTLGVANLSQAQLERWASDTAGGETAWSHGLWSWNWADSHRPVTKIDATGGTVTVGNDDVNRDVNPIKTGSGSQGGNVYFYNLKSELDQAGEYYIDRKSAMLWVIPPPAANAGGGDYHVSRLPGPVVSVAGVANVTFSGLEIRYARGGGVTVSGSTGVVVRGCTVSDNGMMGVNMTNGTACGVDGSNVANNGDAGVVLFGGDRNTLTPSGHFVSGSTLHHNQRWILNYAPDVLLGGVGQTARGCEIYGSPQIGVFFQGNDHTLEDSSVHDVGRQCSDCGAFYMGRDWTYRGNQILRTNFSSIASVWHSTPSAVYLDDQLSSVRIAFSTFDRVPGFLIELGGGRRNEFVYNTIIGDTNLHMDARGGGGMSCAKPGRLPFDFLSRVPYKSAPWSKYPGLADILTDDPCTPKHNVISNNVLCGGATSINLNPSQVAAWGSTMANNTKGRC